METNQIDETSPDVALNFLPLLVKVGEARTKRERRLFQLLRPFNGTCEGWAVQVPPHFNAALDIRITYPKAHLMGIPTQGVNFSFSAGDLLYTTESKPIPWADFLKEDWILLKVVHAMPATAPSVALPRHPGSVTFQILCRNDTRSGVEPLKTCTVTQDEFLILLISGSVKPAIGASINLSEYL